VTCTVLSLHLSGVGTVAAVVALAQSCYTFQPNIDFDNCFLKFYS